MQEVVKILTTFTRMRLTLWRLSLSTGKMTLLDLVSLLAGFPIMQIRLNMIKNDDVDSIKVCVIVRMHCGVVLHGFDKVII